MPRMGFETTLQVFQRTKMVHALHSAATVIGDSTYYITNFLLKWFKTSANKNLQNISFRQQFWKVASNGLKLHINDKPYIRVENWMMIEENTKYSAMSLVDFLH
jgi:hypothetical protein